MEHNVVVRMAKVLYGMVLAVFVFNLLVLPLVPGYTMMAYEGMGMGHPSISSLMGTMRSLLGAGVPAWEILVVRPLAMLGGDWSGYGPEVWWSAAFFLGCGICTAVLLWQARCILSTIIAQTPFQRSNARSMKRAAASCWGIALLAAVRMAVWFLRLRSAAPLFTFTALFIPVSLMAGLLFLVMSALFRQAAELAGWTVPEHGWWYLLDRQEDREGSMFQRSSFNYTLAVYDSAAATLSYLEFDT